MDNLLSQISLFVIGFGVFQAILWGLIIIRIIFKK